MTPTVTTAVGGRSCSGRQRVPLIAVALTAVLAGCAPPPPLYRTVPEGWGRDIPAAAVNVAYGAHPRHRLDVYRAVAGPPRGTIVFLHGGGWSGGDKSERHLLPGSLLAQTRRGYGLVSMNYRLAGDGPSTAPLQDIAAVVDWVRTRGRDHGLDPSRVILAGFSAGAHLATLYATSANDPTPAGNLPPVAGVVALAGAYDLTRLGNFFPGVSAWWPSPLARVAGSPTQWVDVADPPMFVAHGVDDGIIRVAHARHFRNVVQLRRAASRLTYVEAAHPHLAPQCRNHEVSCGVPADDLERFLDRL